MCLLNDELWIIGIYPNLSNQTFIRNLLIWWIQRYHSAFIRRQIENWYYYHFFTWRS